MRGDLKITIVQADLSWEDKKGNLLHFDQLLQQVDSTDLILLPEMFSTGFTMNTSLAEDMIGESVAWMKTKAKEKNAAIAGSIIISEGNKVYNRLVWMNPDGTQLQYDKRHLFRMGNEHHHFTAGNKKIFPEIKGWRICPLICYDLRFPVWSRNVSPYYDLLIYVANWPKVRSQAWKSLLVARALENQCVVAGINRVGKDGNEIEHSGDSCVIDARGNIISGIQPGEEKTENVVLSAADLDHFRRTFPVLEDADDFKLVPGG